MAASPAYVEQLSAHSGHHWWYEARRELVRLALGPHIAQGSSAIDIGCGTGEQLELLADLGASQLAGTDLTWSILQHAQSRLAGIGHHVSLSQALAESLPFADSIADTVISMDVIEHVEDDLAALQEFHRILRPGGRLLLTVPTYQSLWSPHDDIAGHRRRYTRAQLRDRVEQSGFALERCTYYFSFLVPPAYALRRTPLRRIFKGNDEEVSSSSPPVRASLRMLCRLERSLLSRGIDLPAGLSILLVARSIS